MSTIIKINAFNELLNQFLNYIESNVTSCRSDIILTRTAISMLKVSNPRLVSSQFLESLIPYEREIMSCNESFFLEFDKNLDKELLTGDNLVQGFKFKKIWESDINDKCKATIFLYIQKLLKLSKQCQ
jgi:hypothetical protein